MSWSYAVLGSTRFVAVLMVIAMVAG